MLLGRDRVSSGVYFFACCMVSLGTIFSSFWILANNSWMQVPVGYSIVCSRIIPTDWRTIVLGPVMMVRWLHVLLAAEGELREWVWPRVPRLVGAVLMMLALATVASVSERDRAVGAVLLDRAWGLVFPALGLLARLGIPMGARRRRDAWPFPMTVLFFVASFATLAVLFWPYMIPYSITVGGAAAPEASLSFLFWGAGVFVLPVIAIYTAVVYWMFRGKLRKGYG
jgi:cytochrome bd ubiquinol oxidase subunit II